MTENTFQSCCSEALKVPTEEEDTCLNMGFLCLGENKFGRVPSARPNLFVAEGAAPPPHLPRRSDGHNRSPLC